MGGEILLTHMIFVYHWTSFVSKTTEKIKEPRKFSKAIAKATDPFYRNFKKILPYLDRFDIRIQLIEVT